MSTTAGTGERKILVIDNYDSFVFNLVQYLQQLGAHCTVVRNDEFKLTDADKYDGVLISPGPGTPEAAGVSVELVKYCAEDSTTGSLLRTPSDCCCIWRNCFKSA
jgi:para-aminobenzoate synthetase component 2